MRAGEGAVIAEPRGLATALADSPVERGVAWTRRMNRSCDVVLLTVSSLDWFNEEPAHERAA